MARYFTATILLQQAWKMDVDAISQAIVDQFPRIGRVEALPGQAEGESGVVTIDEASIILVSEPTRVDLDRLAPPTIPAQRWNPDAAIENHAARLTVSCGGRLRGVDGAKAYAAATHFVAAAAAAVTPAAAVLWNTGWCFSSGSVFVDAGLGILCGKMPVPAWVGVAPSAPEREEASDPRGFTTVGLRPFIGHELALMPSTDGARARDCLIEIARAVLDRGLVLEDGQRLISGTDLPNLTVRAHTYLLRRDRSVIVLEPDPAGAEATAEGRGEQPAA